MRDIFQKINNIFPDSDPEITQLESLTNFTITLTDRYTVDLAELDDLYHALCDEEGVTALMKRHISIGESRGELEIYIKGDKS